MWVTNRSNEGEGLLSGKTVLSSWCDRPSEATDGLAATGFDPCFLDLYVGTSENGELQQAATPRVGKIPTFR
jgi:hypothetical protein